MPVDYSQLQAPPISLWQVTEAAVQFRKEYWGDKESPLGIMGIVEFDLKIRIIPVPGFESVCNTNCFITPDWRAIHIDKKQYENEAYDQRTNFSLAHEIGHFVLHREFYDGLQIKTIEDFYTFYRDFPPASYDKLEKQAHRFAARLLVPRDELVVEIAKITKAGKISEMSRLLQEKFDVSIEALMRRILEEGIKIDIAQTDFV